MASCVSLILIPFTSTYDNLNAPSITYYSRAFILYSIYGSSDLGAEMKCAALVVHDMDLDWRGGLCCNCGITDREERWRSRMICWVRKEGIGRNRSPGD